MRRQPAAFTWHCWWKCSSGGCSAGSATYPLPVDGSAATGGVGSGGIATGGSGGGTDCPSGAVGTSGGAGAGTPARISFGSVRLSGAGYEPEFIASADFNGDGRVDFVVGSARTGGRILINDGTGNFADHTQLGESFLNEVAVGDMNGDGIPDVILDSFGRTEVWINDGTGTMAMLGAYPTGAPSSVADLNGDGRDDVVVGATVFMNKGDGSLADGVAYGSAGAGFRGLLADMNGDAKPDMVVTNSAASSVRILLNQGDGTFSSPVETPIAGTIVDLEAADLDGDGAVDLAFISAQAACTWRVDVLRNHGSGTLTAAGWYSLAVKASDLAIADLDGDGTSTPSS